MQMKFFKKYFNFSKILIFMLVVAFFAILCFDAYIILELINLIKDGFNLMYATVIGTVTATMSTFSNAVILFGVKGYLHKSGLENSVGYDSKTNTISDERINQILNGCDGSNI